MKAVWRNWRLIERDDIASAARPFHGESRDNGQLESYGTDHIAEKLEAAVRERGESSHAECLIRRDGSSQITSIKINNLACVVDASAGIGIVHVNLNCLLGKRVNSYPFVCGIGRACEIGDGRDDLNG